MKSSPCSFWVSSTSTWRLVFPTSEQFRSSSTLEAEGGSSQGRRFRVHPSLETVRHPSCNCINHDQPTWSIFTSYGTFPKESSVSKGWSSFGQRTRLEGMVKFAFSFEWSSSLFRVHANHSSIFVLGHTKYFYFKSRTFHVYCTLAFQLHLLHFWYFVNPVSPLFVVENLNWEGLSPGVRYLYLCK